MWPRCKNERPVRWRVGLLTVFIGLRLIFRLARPGVGLPSLQGSSMTCQDGLCKCQNRKKKDMTGSTEANYLRMSIHENMWELFIGQFFYFFYFFYFHVIGSFPQAHLRRLTFWMKSTNWLWARFCASVRRKRSDRRSLGPPEPGENHIGRKCSIGICWVLEGWQDLINISASLGFHQVSPPVKEQLMHILTLVVVGRKHILLETYAEMKVDFVDKMVR